MTNPEPVYLPLEYEEGTPGRPYLKIEVIESLSESKEKETSYKYKILQLDGTTADILKEWSSPQTIHTPDLRSKLVFERQLKDAHIKTSFDSLKDLQPVEFEENPKELLIEEILIEYGEPDQARRQFVFNPEELAVYIETYKKDENDRGEEIIKLSGKDKIISAYPVGITILQSPLSRETTYKLEWKAKRALYPFETEGSPGNIISALKEYGYILKGYAIEDRFSRLLDTAFNEGYTKTNYKMDKPGFFLFDGEITPSMYDMTTPTQEETREALEILESFAEAFSNDKVERDQRDKIASTIKLALTLPFNYVRKKIGYSEVIKPPLAYGKTGSGKTTINLLPAYIYGQNIDDYEKAGSNVMTPARFAEVMGLTTFPTMIDEAGNIFDNKELMEVNKTGLRREYVRNKLTKDGRKIPEPAYSTFIYLANYPPIKDSNDGTVRRYHIHHYEELEYKGEQEESVKSFNKRFKPRDPESPLLKLEVLGRFAAAYILHDKRILGRDMMEAGQEIINEMYGFINQEPPEWITWEATTENIEDFGAHENEVILSFIRAEAMRAYRDKILVDDGGYGKREKLTNKDDEEAIKAIKDRYYQVAKEGIIPWLFYKESQGSFFLRSTFKDDLARTRGLSLSLKSIAQKFEGWEYIPFRDPKNRKVSRMIKIPQGSFYDNLIENMDKKDTL